jgi:hypothetical protein
LPILIFKDFLLRNAPEFSYSNENGYHLKAHDLNYLMARYEIRLARDRQAVNCGMKNA